MTELQVFMEFMTINRTTGHKGQMDRWKKEAALQGTLDCASIFCDDLHEKKEKVVAMQVVARKKGHACHDDTSGYPVQRLFRLLGRGFLLLQVPGDGSSDLRAKVMHCTETSLNQPKQAQPIKFKKKVVKKVMTGYVTQSNRNDDGFRN